MSNVSPQTPQTSLRSNRVKSLLYAFLVCLGGSAALFATLSLIGVQSDAAKTIALAAFALLPKVREEIVKALAPPTPDVVLIQSFGEFAVRPSSAVLYPALVAFAVPNALSALVGLTATLASIPASNIAQLLLPLNLVFNTIVFYACGNWVGRRTGATRYLWSLSAAALCVALSVLATYTLLSENFYREFFGHEKRPFDAAYHYLFWLTQSVPFFLVGTYVGAKQRLSAYLAYLAQHLGTESQTALVDLAYEEALRLRAKPAAPPQ
jgi:hypothetical protein